MKVLIICIIICLWANYFQMSAQKPHKSIKAPKNKDKVVCNWCKQEFKGLNGGKNFKEHHRKKKHEYMSYSAYGMKTSFFQASSSVSKKKTTKQNSLNQNQVKKKIPINKNGDENISNKHKNFETTETISKISGTDTENKKETKINVEKKLKSKQGVKRKRVVQSTLLNEWGKFFEFQITIGKLIDQITDHEQKNYLTEIQNCLQNMKNEEGKLRQ